MSTKVVPGILIATLDAPTLASEAASRIAKALKEAIDRRGAATLALSGGSTPLPAYALLAKEPGIAWDKTQIFWVDERAVPPDDAQSNYGAAKTAFLDALPVPRWNIHRMAGDEGDLQQAAADYASLVETRVKPAFDATPSFDVVVLGVGDDGHTASLFPGDPALQVRDKWVTAVAAKDGRVARLTLTAPILENARTLFIIAMGASKAPPLERVWRVEGDYETTPARVIRNARGSIVWIIDQAAGGLNDP